MKVEQRVQEKDCGPSLDSFWRACRGPLSVLSLVAAAGCVGGGNKSVDSELARGEAERRLSGESAAGEILKGEKIPLWPSVESSPELAMDAYGILRRIEMEQLRARPDFDPSPASVQQLVAASLSHQILPFTEAGALISNEDRLDRAALVSALLKKDSGFEQAQQRYRNLTAPVEASAAGSSIDRDKYWADRLDLVTLATTGRVEFTSHAKALILLRRIEAQPDLFFNLNDYETLAAYTNFKSWPEPKRYFAANLFQTMVKRGDVGIMGMEELLESHEALPDTLRNFASAYLRTIAKEGSFEQQLYQERFAVSGLLR